jgi:hypothetical protein
MAETVLISLHSEQSVAAACPVYFKTGHLAVIRIMAAGDSPSVRLSVAILEFN